MLFKKFKSGFFLLNLTLVFLLILFISFFSKNVFSSNQNQQNNQNVVENNNQTEQQKPFHGESMTPIGAGFGTLGGKTQTNEVQGGKVNFDDGPFWLVSETATTYAFVDKNNDKVYDEIWGWGDNNHGALGNGNETIVMTPMRLDNISQWSNMLSNNGRIVYFYNGYNSAIAFVDKDIDGNLDGQYDEIWGWGWGWYGQLGTSAAPANSEFLSPIRLDNLPEWSTDMLANGAQIVDFYYSGAVTFAFIDAQEGDGNLDGQYDEIWGWGDNTYGTLGFAPKSKDIVVQSTPIRLDTLPEWSSDMLDNSAQIVDFYIGLRATFAFIDTQETDNNLDGQYDEIWGWGDNYSGTLGIGSTDNQTTPMRLDTLPIWTTMLANGAQIVDFYNGYQTTFVFVDTNDADQLYDQIWGWGSNDKGTLGVNDFGTRTSPERLDTIWTFEDGKKIINFCNGFLTTFAFVDVNNDQMYDEIWGWGDNYVYELGINITSPSFKTTPIRLDNTTQWSSDMLANGAKIIDFYNSDQAVFAFVDTNNNQQYDELWGWGHNQYSTLGILPPLDIPTPTLIKEFPNTPTSNSQIKIDEIIPSINGARVYYYWSYNPSETPAPTLEYQVLLSSNSTEVIAWTNITSTSIANDSNVYFDISNDLIIGNTTYTLQMRTEGGDSTIKSMNFTTLNQQSVITINNVTTTENSATVTYYWVYDQDTRTPTLEYQVLNSNNQPIQIWTSVQNPTPNNPNATFTINNLSDNSTYLLQMRTESRIVISYSFNTLNADSTISIGNITPSINGAVVTYNWTYSLNVVNPTLQYKVTQGSTTTIDWTSVQNPIPNNPAATFTIDGLVGNTQYTLQMRTESGVVVQSTFTTTNQFSNIAIGNITPSVNSVVVTYNWTYDQDSITPTLEYQVLDTNNNVVISWVSVQNPTPNNPNATFTINDLLPSTTYTLQMRTESGNIISQVFTTTSDYLASIISISNVSPTTTTAVVTYNWTYDANRTSNPTLQYKVTQGSTTTIDWTSVQNPTPNNPNATFTIDGLTANTQYLLQMKTESGSIVNYTFTTFDLTSTVTIGTINSNTNDAIVTYNWVYNPLLTTDPTLEYQVIKTNNSSIVKNWTKVPSIPNNPNATFTIDGLVGNTQYTLQMRTESGVVVQSTFTTTNQFSNIAIGNITPSVNSAVVTYNWTYDQDSITPTLEYQVLDTNNNVVISWVSVQNPTPNNPNATFTINDLSPSTTYTLQMRTESGVITESTFITNQSDLSIINIINISPNVENAIVTYNWVTEANSYVKSPQYQVLDANGNVVQSWNTITNAISNDSTATFEINNLTANTTYVLQMKTEFGGIVEQTFTTNQSYIEIIIITTATVIAGLTFAILITFNIRKNPKIF